MGLFDKFKSKFVSPEGRANPPEATFATRPDTVCAPISGSRRRTTILSSTERIS